MSSSLSTTREPASSCLWLRTTIQFAWSFVEIPKQCRTQPALNLELWRVIPIASILLASPFKSDRVTGKRRRGEKQPKAFLCIRNRCDQPVDHRVDASNEWLAHKPDRGVVENPHALVFVWCDNSNGIHIVAVCSKPQLSDPTRGT